MASSNNNEENNVDDNNNNNENTKEELSSEEIAKQLISEGITHYRSDAEDSYEKARLAFESARDVAKAGGCELQEARALGNLANAYSNLNENIQASDLYRLSIVESRKRLQRLSSNSYLIH